MALYTALLEIAYLFWRACYTLCLTNILNAFVSVLLLSAEALGCIQQMIFYRIMAAPRVRRPHRLSTLDYYPSVDVFIATYNEPLEVLRRTLTACTYLDYPKDKLNVYVLDDGCRNEVRSLAEQLGIHYIARPTREHAKAGNLNYALSKTKGELIVTLDADMVPKSFFLKRTVGYFKKRRVAFVQAPQIFFNPDLFQHNLRSNDQVTNEQDFFMIEMQSARESFNSVMYVGSNTVFSRRALETIGGFLTGTLTEDVATSMLLQARGYKGKFVRDVLAKGLSPESFEELLHQRDRWCRGNLQVAKKWNPLTLPGLRMMQRFIYMSGVLYWYFGVQKIIFIAAPILYLDFGIQPLRAALLPLAAMWLPKFLASMLTFRVLAGDRRNLYWSHIYETAQAPVLARSALAETLGIAHKNRFHVTRKGVTQSSVRIASKVFWTHCVLLGFCLSGFVASMHSLVTTHAIGGAYVVNELWNLYNTVAVILSIFVSIEQPRYRRTERFPKQVHCKVFNDRECYEGYSVDISETGIRVELPYASLVLSGEWKIAIEGLSSTPLAVRAIAWTGAKEDPFRYRFEWVHLTHEQYRELVKFIFDDEEDVENQYRLAAGHSVLATLFRTWHVKVDSLPPKGDRAQRNRTSRDSWHNTDVLNILDSEYKNVRAMQLCKTDRACRPGPHCILNLSTCA